MARRTFSIFLSLLCSALIVGISYTPAAADDVFVSTPGYVYLGPEDLQQLAAPVALYPDALLAQILVACTYPNDVVAAAQFLDAGNDPNLIDSQGFDLSVAGVARYPDLLHYLAANLDWTNNLGLAFLNQQADVMAAVQALRSEALAAGNLVSNDQQQVIVDNGTIEIIPADPQVIYPPIYDPVLVYRRPVIIVGTPYVPLIHFWRGIRVGIWLHHDLDWHDHAVYLGAWGFERPWWRHERFGDDRRRFEYTHDRPGLYISKTTNITVNVDERVVNIQGGQWSRQRYAPEKPLPRVVANNRYSGRPAYVRPGTGYAPREPIHAGGEVHNYNNGAIISHESHRGRESRQRAGITHGPGTFTPPNRPAGPTHSQQPAHVPERHAVPPPAPAPHPVAPARVAPSPQRSAPVVRGGATSGYTNGSDAARASNRGAHSRSNANPNPHDKSGHPQKH